VTLPTPGNHLPVPRGPQESEPSMIKEFMRQIGVPNSASN
jgi:hypothetical protein